MYLERCGKGIGKGEDDMSLSEWYFFKFKDHKYPSGTRTKPSHIGRVLKGHRLRQAGAVIVIESGCDR
jgi:hypothetical protein